MKIICPFLSFFLLIKSGLLSFFFFCCFLDSLLFCCFHCDSLFLFFFCFSFLFYRLIYYSQRPTQQYDCSDASTASESLQSLIAFIFFLPFFPHSSLPKYTKIGGRRKHRSCKEAHCDLTFHSSKRLTLPLIVYLFILFFFFFDLHSLHVIFPFHFFFDRFNP